MKNTKKFLSVLLSLILVLLIFSGCANTSSDNSGTSTDAESVAPDVVSTLDWSGYDEKIATIKTTTNLEERTSLMYDAESDLMSTWCVIPIYYYNDIYMQQDFVEGMYSSVFGTKYFMYSTMTNGSDTIKINLASEPDHLDPALNSSVDGATLAADAFSGLYTIDENGDYKADLAESYEVSDDGLTYTFKLRDGLKWSDGSDLTANDFVYSWNRAISTDTAADYAYMFSGFAGYDDGTLDVTAVDDTTLKVVLSSPCAYMLDLMSFPTFFPVKQSEVEKYDDYKTNPGHWAQEAGFVSCGAYVLTEWNHDTSMVYEKNPYYYNAENVTIERQEFMLSADDTAIFSAYNAGDLDFADTVPTDEIANLKDNPEFHIIDNLGTYYICFNIKSDMFAGKTVEQAEAMREAFSMLIDREYICENIGQTGQVPANSFIPIGMSDGNGGIFKTDTDDDSYFDPYAINNDYDSTVANAVELLKSAGFEFNDDNTLSSSTPISFEYLTNESTNHVAIASAVQQDLSVIGINMTVQQEEWNTFLNDRKEGNYDIARNGWLADFNDPINMLEMWTTDSGNNDIQFGK